MHFIMKLHGLNGKDDLFRRVARHQLGLCAAAVLAVDGGRSDDDGDGGVVNGVGDVGDEGGDGDDDVGGLGEGSADEGRGVDDDRSSVGDERKSGDGGGDDDSDRSSGARVVLLDQHPSVFHASYPLLTAAYTSGIVLVVGAFDFVCLCSLIHLLVLRSTWSGRPPPLCCTGQSGW